MLLCKKYLRKCKSKSKAVSVLFYFCREVASLVWVFKHNERGTGAAVLPAFRPLLLSFSLWNSHSDSCLIGARWLFEEWVKCFSHNSEELWTSMNWFDFVFVTIPVTLQASWWLHVSYSALTHIKYPGSSPNKYSPKHMQSKPIELCSFTAEGFHFLFVLRMLSPPLSFYSDLSLSSNN